MTLKNRNKITAVIIIILLISLCHNLLSTVTYAEVDSPNVYDQTKVMDDLESMTIEDAPFNVNKYPYSSNSILYKPKVVTMVEYCYSPNIKLASRYYSLYIYLYNPRGNDINKRIDITSGRNTATFATSYNEKGEPTNFESFSLRYCDMSDGNQAGKFYKFKVIDRDINGTKFYDRVNSEERRYDIGDLDIDWIDDALPETVRVGNLYKFRGYAEGCGPNESAASSLENDSTDTDVIELDISQVTYRSLTNSLGEGHRNQLTSVYFAVPNDYINKYGELQGVHAEWFEFKTALGLVTSNLDDYKGMYERRHSNYKYDGSDNFKYGFALNHLYAYQVGNQSASHWEYLYGFPEQFGAAGHSADTEIPCIPFVFRQEDFKKDISYKTVMEYMLQYSKDFSDNKLTAKNPDGTTRTFKYNAKLFSDDITQLPNNNERKRGYDSMTFKSIDELYNMDIMTDEDYKNTLTFWELLFGKEPTEEELGKPVKGIKPIQKVTTSDVANVTDFGDTLFVGEEYCSDFQSYVKANSSTSSTYLLRFALTDYFSQQIQAVRNFKEKNNAYVFEQSAFLDFNIISLTFCNKNGTTTIPVSASPIDIVGGVTAPSDMQNRIDWELILKIILLILAFLLLLPFLPLLFRALAWIIKMLAKTIAAPFEVIGKKDKNAKIKIMSTNSGERIYKLDNASAAQQVQDKSPKVKKSKAPKVKAPKVKKSKAPKVKAPKAKKSKERKSKGKQDKPG